MSSSPSDFNSLGNLLDPTPEEIALNAERARLHAEAVAVVEANLKFLAEWKARRAAMTPEEIEEMREERAGYGPNDEPLWIDWQD